MNVPVDGSSFDPDLAHWEGEPVAVWEAVWGIPRFEAWSHLPSTNDRARALALADTAAWTVVVARGQSAGRGRAGARWESPDGTGLWASIVVRPRSMAQSSLLPLLTGVALARTLERDPAAEGLRCGLKWPNDVWAGEGKVAGILCEAAGEAVVVGVGVNLREPSGGFGALHAPQARALEAVTGTSWSAGRVLGALLRELRTLSDPPVLRFDGTVARDWKERDILLGQAVRVGAVEGWVRGVDPTGGLVVEDRDGTRTVVRAGHVEWPIDR